MFVAGWLTTRRRPDLPGDADPRPRVQLRRPDLKSPRPLAPTLAVGRAAGPLAGEGVSGAAEVGGVGGRAAGVPAGRVDRAAAAPAHRGEQLLHRPVHGRLPVGQHRRQRAAVGGGRLRAAPRPGPRSAAPRSAGRRSRGSPAGRPSTARGPRPAGPRRPAPRPACSSSEVTSSSTASRSPGIPTRVAMPNAGSSTTRTPFADPAACTIAALASACGSSRCSRRACTCPAVAGAPRCRPSIAVSMACRAISSWALAVSASASASKSVDSALASSPRIRLSARASTTSSQLLSASSAADQPDGGGSSCSSRGRLRSRPDHPQHVPPGRRPRRCPRPATSRRPCAAAPASSASCAVQARGARPATSAADGLPGDHRGDQPGLPGR